MISQLYKLCYGETNFYVIGTWMPKLSLILAVTHVIGSIFSVPQNRKLNKHFEMICVYRQVGRL